MLFCDEFWNFIPFSLGLNIFYDYILSLFLAVMLKIIPLLRSSLLGSACRSELKCKKRKEMAL